MLSLRSCFAIAYYKVMSLAESKSSDMAGLTHARRHGQREHHQHFHTKIYILWHCTADTIGRVDVTDNTMSSYRCRPMQTISRKPIQRHAVSLMSVTIRPV